ncbi:hypothetical protein FRC17_008697, partial [Serendipita sp. 399]
DSQDWTQSAANGATPASIQAAFTRWLNGPRNPGLIVLQHEITPAEVAAFISVYPLIAAASQAGLAQGLAPWRTVSISQLFDGSVDGTQGNPEHDGWYQNSWNNTAPVEDADIIDDGYAVTLTARPTTTAPPSGTQSGPQGPSGTTTPTQSVSVNSAPAAVGVFGQRATV